MHYRVATVADISQLDDVRRSVAQNGQASDFPITPQEYEEYLLARGRGWVCETLVDGQAQIIGFAIADLQSNNLWALFVRPEFEGQGVGRKLHQLMLDWYFAQTEGLMWLGTAPNTRAEGFYRKLGWLPVGEANAAELNFIMTRDDWMGAGLIGEAAHID
jgi:GNAT superfamily N-acetyltransferase